MQPSLPRSSRRGPFPPWTRSWPSVAPWTRRLPRQCSMLAGPVARASGRHSPSLSLCRTGSLNTFRTVVLHPDLRRRSPDLSRATCSGSCRASRDLRHPCSRILRPAWPISEMQGTCGVLFLRLPLERQSAGLAYCLQLSSAICMSVCCLLTATPALDRHQVPTAASATALGLRRRPRSARGEGGGR